MNKLFYTWNMFREDHRRLSQLILTRESPKYRYVCGVPKGGLVLATALASSCGCEQVGVEEAKQLKRECLVCDDILDSGKTRAKFPDNDFAVIHCRPDKLDQAKYWVHSTSEWVVYPWESEAEQNGPTEAIVRLLEYIGEDPTREGLLETPSRVIKAYDELFAGYNQDPKEIFKTFDGSQIGGLIYLKNIEFYSFCEHHMIPFYGSAHIGYISNGRVIGVSKLARLLDIFSKRLQIQERIGEQVTTALMDYLNPIGAACIIEAKHLCISGRGVKKQHSVMGYSSFKGVFLEDSLKGMAARNEFQALIK